MSDLESVYNALCQAQDCIRGETPEDITDAEAREDTINKVRDAMRTIEAMQVRAPAATPPTDPFNRKQVEAICRAVCKVEGVDPDDDVFGDGCDAQWTRYANAVADALLPEQPAATPPNEQVAEVLGQLENDHWAIGGWWGNEFCRYDDATKKVIAALRASPCFDITADTCALAEIREIIADGKYRGEYLIGMIDGIAKRGTTRSVPPLSLLKNLYDEVNALGGRSDQDNSYDQGIVDTVANVLGIVERAQAALSRDTADMRPQDILNAHDKLIATIKGET